MTWGGNALLSPARSLDTCQHRCAASAGRTALCCTHGLTERELLAGEAEGTQLVGRLSKRSRCRLPFLFCIYRNGHRREEPGTRLAAPGLRDEAVLRGLVSGC